MDMITVILLLVIVIFLFYKMGKTQNEVPPAEMVDNTQNKEPFLLNQKQKNRNRREHDIVQEVMDANNNSTTNEYDNDTSLGFSNPLFENIDPDRNKIEGVDQNALDRLIQEVNQGNNIPSNTNNAKLFRDKVKSIDSAKKYRRINYKDSNYRDDFNGDGVSKSSQDKLDTMYDDALIFHNSEYQLNSNFTGMTEEDVDEYASSGIANLQDSMGKPTTQKEKIMNMYNSNNYLPGKPNEKLEKGFQILENPTSVSNPNLIPVLRAMPVSSTLGSKRNSSWDLRGDVPNPKTVVAPWNNSSIYPDIYSSNRGCL